MQRGCFITIEGIEGAGKSTAVDFIKTYLEKKGREVVITREPGGTELAEEIRGLLLHPRSKEKMAPLTELLLMFSGRAQHVTQLITPALLEGKAVLSDRFIDASYAYQGGGRGVDFRGLRILDKLVVGEVYPDLTLLMDISVAEGMQRTEKRGNGKDRIEHEAAEFFERVRQVYLDRAKADPARIKIIDASLSIEKVQAQIEFELEDYLKRAAL